MILSFALLTALFPMVGLAVVSRSAQRERAVCGGAVRYLELVLQDASPSGRHEVDGPSAR